MNFSLQKALNFICYMFLFFFTTMVCAGSQRDYKSVLQDKPIVISSHVMTLSLAPAWYSGDESQTFYLQPDVQKTYSADTKTQVLFDGELFLGLQRQLSANLHGQLGLAVAATSSAKLDGDIWEDADSNFNNYNYSYKINHTHVAVKGKLLSDIQNRGIFAYVSASLGAGFNHAYGFTITPKIFEEVPAPLFSSYTQTAFTYTLGIGVQKAINSHWEVGVGYEFADWGKSQLDSAPGQTVNNGLQLNHLYTHALQFSLSCLA